LVWKTVGGKDFREDVTRGVETSSSSRKCSSAHPVVSLLSLLLLLLRGRSKVVVA